MTTTKKTMLALAALGALLGVAPALAADATHDRQASAAGSPLRAESRAVSDGSGQKPDARPTPGPKADGATEPETGPLCRCKFFLPDRPTAGGDTGSDYEPSP